jgi:F0F1-type ATP synthase assembly protein I
MTEKQPSNNRNLLLQYAGFAFEVIAGIGVAVYAGLKLDSWLKTKHPLLIWLLPLIVIIALIVKAIKDTSTKNGNKEK